MAMIMAMVHVGVGGGGVDGVSDDVGCGADAWQSKGHVMMTMMILNMVMDYHVVLHDGCDASGSDHDECLFMFQLFVWASPQAWSYLYTLWVCLLLCLLVCLLLCLLLCF